MNDDSQTNQPHNESVEGKHTGSEPARGDEVRIDWHIGDDPDELSAVAERVVRGEAIEHAEIKSLRKLIEAVHAHPEARLAPPKDQRPDNWSPPDDHAVNRLTELKIIGGIVLDGDYQALDTRVTLACSARFAGEARFGGASIAGEARFDGASIAGEARFDRASFAGAARFDRASFAGEVSGDFRGAQISAALFAEEARKHINPAAEEQDERRAPAGLARRACSATRTRLTESWQSAHRWRTRRFGWGTVRGLGQLAILSRVSLIALIAVPVIAAFWPAVRAAAGAYHRYVGESHAAIDRLVVEARKVTADGAVPPNDELHSRIDRALSRVEKASNDWHVQMEGMVRESPHIGPTLVFTFFAAVAVTLGLLVYQTAGTDEVRKFDEDEFVDLAHKRYPEGAADRDDGLRRAIKHLEDIANVRPDRHRNFVQHHGDTIWVPPGEKIEWFNDLMEAPKAAMPPAEGKEAEAPESTEQEQVTDGGTESGAPGAPPKVALVPRAGQVPGAERRRIVIEEGARAEYWLKSREKVVWAGISFALYGVGITFLLLILCIQIWNVMKAAGWVAS